MGNTGHSGIGNGKSRKIKPTKWPKKSNEMFAALIKHYRVSNDHSMDYYVDPKRIVFISIDGLYRTWKQCPPTLLYTSLFLLPLKEKWIASPHKCDRRYSLMFQDEEFICLLRWKLSQKLFFCLLDNNVDGEIGDNIQQFAPVWHQISSRLQELYDPMTRRRYNALMLDATYLSRHAPHLRLTGLNAAGNRFALSANDIMLALQSLSFKFTAIEHILLSSNSTLNVMTNFQRTTTITSCASAVVTKSSSAASVSVLPTTESREPVTSISSSPTLSLHSAKANPCADIATQGFVWIGAEYYFDS